MVADESGWVVWNVEPKQQQPVRTGNAAGEAQLV
jgi:hypothetical protein